ncbi:Capsular polysaccharide synthesis protein [Methanobrevibacter millerae]|uniref:Capsular polysaccharide synthesis protein n=2 Tax=Methanobrevibacter millerae TaxID=230361 RepID=A0A1G5WWH0_9EURY|nr:Capsular polysaccharide synthesis protein [Methanobrevibacter millerae]
MENSLKQMSIHYLNLIKHHIKNHTITTMAVETILLGKNQKSYEIMGLCVEYKIKRQLKNKYYANLIEFDENYDENVFHEKSNKVWFCWFQGIENAPEIVKICYTSAKDNLKDKEVILITEENMFDYITFPQFIIEKWKKGIISNTHISDLLRLELLIKYGGLWLDATVFCSSSNIPDYINNSNLFFYQHLTLNKYARSTFNSSWLISAKSNNKVLLATRYLLYKYWEKNDYQIDYFILHHFMTIVLEFYPETWNKIVPVDNSTPHILQSKLFEIYDHSIWDSLQNSVCFHKLTYKFDDEKTNKNDTYYKKVLLNE